MRVLHLNAGNMYGGIETYLVTLARQWRLCPEMEPEFGLCFRGRLWDELTAAGVAVHDLGAVRLSRPWTVLRSRGRLRSLLHGTAFTVAVTHGNWPHAVFAPVVHGVGIYLANAVHGEYGRPTWLDRWAARTAPDVVLANSRFTSAPAVKLFSRSRVEVAYLPVAPPESFDRAAARREVRAELGTPPGAVVVLQASRLEEWKGQRVHVAALARLKDVPGWEAWFAGGAQKTGETEFLAELKELALRGGIADRVRFLGQRADVPRLLTAADVYCQPNTGPEPFGIVYVEALYAGLPVVASGFGGAAEIIDETCGVLAPPRNAEALAEALVGLIREPGRRVALGAAGPARASELCAPAARLGELARLLDPASSVRATRAH